MSHHEDYYEDQTKNARSEASVSLPYRPYIRNHKKYKKSKNFSPLIFSEYFASRIWILSQYDVFLKSQFFSNPLQNFGIKKIFHHNVYWMIKKNHV